MKEVKFSVMCNAVYYGKLMVDDELDEDEVLEEIHNRLDEVPANDIAWLGDLDPDEAVTAEDIIYIGDPQ